MIYFFQSWRLLWRLKKLAYHNNQYLSKMNGFSINLKVIYFIFFLLCCFCVNAQKLPVIKATSKSVKIRNGEILKENFWVIFPETKPDVYWVDFPKKEQTVTFITDIDSISFNTKYGNNYDFIILLNGKDSCYTLIAANYPKFVSVKNSVPIDTIPFTMKDNRIYVKGSINNSKEITFQFDLGAGGIGMSFINHKSVDKVALKFDKTTSLSNSDGINQTRMSTANNIKIGKTEWQNIEVVESKNMNNYEDAIFGNGLFLDKYVEVDYNNSLLIIHDSLPAVGEQYKKLPIRVNQSVCPEVEATIEIDGKQYKEWFGFDTGNTSNGIFNNGFLTKNNIYDKFSKIFAFGDRALAKMPTMQFASYTFSEGTIVLERNNNISSNSSGGGVIGNKLLKKFNFVLDTHNGFIYVKPSIYFNEKNNEIRNIYIGFGLISLLLISIVTLIIKFYKRRKARAVKL
jgi:hypothetical protein